MLEKCTSLRKLAFTHGNRRFDRSEPLDSFSPKHAISTMEPVASTLERLGLFCGSAFVTNLSISSLITTELHLFRKLTILDIDEQIFCRHWQNITEPPTCLIGMLPATMCSFTLRLHDKYRAVGDIIHLGEHISKLETTRLTRVRVLVLYDRSRMAYQSRDKGYYLEPSDEYAEQLVALQALALNIRPSIMNAFRGAKTLLTVEFQMAPFFLTMFDGNRLQYSYPPAEY